MAEPATSLTTARVTQPTSVLEDARLTFSVAHELCYAIDNLIDEALGATPEAARAKPSTTSSGAFPLFAASSEEIRERMQQTIYRLQSFRSQLGANT